ncbi:CD99 antigen-like protein 2 isoform X2 [Scomber japonicus]|uniref:CD99 antigen-like protein 2 isoform X2 n=1 Tax=Scomber japonicus TaxID=13676 RepID=UPI002305F3D8|nr:CD99 antigen-like protein 2 isoform X2 [Scomber japonicus]
MMSYLWILLLGSLLAGSAKAQDDAAPEENTAAPESPTSESDTAPESEGGEGSDHNAEELQPTVKETESADDAEAVTPADEGAVTPADADKEQDTPVDADKEQDTPADADAEPETPKDEGAVTPADGNAGAVTPAADTEAEATTPAQDPAPAADPEVKEPETGEPAEEQPASNTEAPPVQEEDGSEGDTKLAADPTVADNVEEPAGPTADAKPTVPVDEDKIVPDTEKGVDVLVPTVKVDLPNVDLGLNLEDALPEGNAVDKNARKGKSLGSNAQAAEATGDADKPEAQESSSGSIAGILSAIVVAAVGAVAGYFTYQKKKLCFKDRQADPEAARKADAVEAQSDPQVLSNLLNSS